MNEQKWKEVADKENNRDVDTTYEKYPVFFFFLFLLVCSVGVYDCKCSAVRNAAVDVPVVRSIINVGGHCCYP
jgi:hypothetical protein